MRNGYGRVVVGHALPEDHRPPYVGGRLEVYEQRRQPHIDYVQRI